MRRRRPPDPKPLEDFPPLVRPLIAALRRQREAMDQEMRLRDARAKLGMMRRAKAPSK